MWGEDAKARAAGMLARVLARYASADRVSRAAARVEHWRTVFDEAAGAFWHFTAMPSKRDIRLLQRRVSALKQRVAELDQIVAALEAAAAEDEDVTAARQPRSDGS
jgi:hypothetical protein